MKSVIILSLFFIGAFSLFNDNEAILMKDLFVQWKLVHGKHYATATEEVYRFKTFIANYFAIQEHQAHDNSVILGLNAFADLSSEEFGRLYTGAIPTHTSSKTKVFDTRDTPSSFDWRTKGGVTAVKNQGSCGSCWAFSAVGTLEGLYFINSSKLVGFSEQNFVDCVVEDFGCGGGWPIDALSYSAKNGIETEADYPYYAVDRKCSFNASKAVRVNTGYYNVTVNSVPQLKAAIAQQPISVCIQANQLVFQFYLGGVIKKGCGANIDHAVLAVGYDNIKGTDAFIVKNSWGEKWGAQGYVYISTDEEINKGQGVCGILTYPAAPENVRK